MVGIADLVVGVAVQVVGQEADGLHHGEEHHGKGQVLALHGGEEAAGALKVALRECLEDVPAEADAVQLGRVLGHGVGCRAQEVTVVGEDVGGHDGVEVDDAEHAALLVEEHVVHLRVAVADALGQLAAAV